MSNTRLIFIAIVCLFCAVYEKLKRLKINEELMIYRDKYEDSVDEYNRLHGEFYDVTIDEIKKGVYTIRQELKPQYKNSEEVYKDE